MTAERPQRETLTTRETQDDPVKAAIVEADLEHDSVRSWLHAGWPVTENEKIFEYLQLARDVHPSDAHLNALNKSLTNYPDKTDSLFKETFQNYHDEVNRFVMMNLAAERLREADRKKKGNSLREQLRRDKYIPTSIEAQYDNYLSTQEYLDDIEFEGDFATLEKERIAYEEAEREADDEQERQRDAYDYEMEM